MKNLFVLTALAFIIACNDQPESKPVPPETATVEAVPGPEQLITPGTGIGHLVIDQPVDTAIAKLGQPDSSDAAMGSALMVWYSKDANRYRTAIFARRNMGNDEVSRIKRIMVSSPWFKTSDGIGAGSSMAAIEKIYRMKKVEDPSAAGKGLWVFDDASRGIAFDIDSISKICKAVSVHASGDSAATYINMH